MMIFNLCVLIVVLACVAAITWSLTAEREWSAGFEKGYALAKAHAKDSAAFAKADGRLEMLEEIITQEIHRAELATHRAQIQAQRTVH